MISSFQCDINVSEITDKIKSNNWNEEEIQAAEGSPQISLHLQSLLLGFS